MTRIKLPEKSWTEIRQELRSRLAPAREKRACVHVGTRRLERLLDESEERDRILEEILEVGRSTKCFHNEEGMWIPWSSIAKALEKYYPET